MNKALSWLLSVAMLFGVLLIGDVINIEVNASGGNVAFGSKNVWLEYGPGDYFTDNGKACTDHGTSGIHSATNESACNCKCTYNGTKLGACQCFGYARYIQTVLFGKNSYNSSGSFYKVSGASVSAGSLTADKLKNIIKSGNVKPGAHIRTNGSAHSMIITQITDNGFSIIQANGSNNNEYSSWSACRIGTYTYTWSSYVSSTYGSRGINYIEMPYDYNIPELNNYADIGTGFYAYLINVQAWKMAAVVNDNVQLQSENAFRNQIWYFERQSDNSYKITNVATGKCLDVNNGESTNGTNVLVWNSNNNNNQRWYFTPKDGNYVIHPKYNTSIALDVNGGSKDDGTNIQIWETNGSGAQTFCVWKFDNKPNKPTVTSSSKTYAVGSNVKVSWGENAFATSYWVDVWHNGNHTESFGINDTSYTVKSVTAGEYTVFVASCNPNGASETGSFTFNVPTYTISYNMNGGSGSISNQTKNYNQDLTLSSTKPTRTGYDFVGWNTSASATTAQYQPGGKYTANSGATLYAIWKAKQIKVTFYRNQNSSDNTTATQTFTYGASGQSFSNKNWTKDGYTLLGWSEDRNATAKQYSTTNTVGSDWINQKSPTLNLYAVWKRVDENLGTYKYANPNKTTLYARISYNGTDKYLTNVNTDSSDRAYKNVQLNTKNDSIQQVWEFEKLSDGGYKIINVFDGKYLDIHNTKTDNGTNIGVCSTYYANGGQIWYLIKKDGKYIIQPKISTSIYLGVANTNDGGNVQVTTSSHQFNIEILKPVGTSTMQAVQEGTSASKTKFTWTAATDATWYNLYIYDGEVWKSNCIYGQKNIKGLEWSVQLKPGTYQAHLSPINIHNWTNSNFVSFTVKENKYTMNYNANGGTGIMNTQTLIFGENFTVPENKFVKTGYDFSCFNIYRSYDNKWYVGDGNGWQTQSDIDKNGYKKKEYRPGDTHSMDIYWTSSYASDLSFTFYPVWKAKQVKVTFYRNQNSSDNTTATQTFTYGASGQSFSNKNWTKDGYTLLGWSENLNATEKQYSITNGVGSDWINQKSPTLNLYAVWKINAPTEQPVISGLNETYNVGENITITWNSVDRASSYWINIWQNPGTESAKIVNTYVDTNSFTLNNLTPGKYGITVDAKNESGSTASGLYNFYVPFTIKYDLNGGTGTIASTYKKLDIECTLSSTKPIRTDYTFAGWSTDKNSSTAQYLPGEKYTGNEDVTLYAVWVSNQYTVNISETNCKVNVTATYNGNRIDVSDGDKVPYGTKLSYESQADYGYYFGVDRNNGNKAITSKTSEEMVVIDNVSITEKAYVKNYRITAYTYAGGYSPIISGRDYAPYNTYITVTAGEAFEDYKFIGWYQNGECVSTDEVYDVKMTSNISICARYEKIA